MDFSTSLSGPNDLSELLALTLNCLSRPIRLP